MSKSLITRTWLLVFAATCIVSNGCSPGNLSAKLQILRFSGDGEIHDSSIFFSPGYRIQFPKFSSAKPYEAAYRLSHVPDLGRGYAAIYLCFNQPDFVMARSKKNSVTASFQLMIYDAKGTLEYSTELQFSNSFWSETQGLFGVFDLKKSHFHFKRNASYVLQVSYSPGDVPPPAEELYFSIEEGGTK